MSLVPQRAAHATFGHRDQPLRPAVGPGRDLDRLLAMDAPQRLRHAPRPGARTDREHPLQDAILDLSDPENPKEPEWPEAEFIVGNPPFLGGNKMRERKSAMIMSNDC